MHSKMIRDSVTPPPPSVPRHHSRGTQESQILCLIQGPAPHPMGSAHAVAVVGTKTERICDILMVILEEPPEESLRCNAYDLCSPTNGRNPVVLCSLV